MRKPLLEISQPCPAPRKVQRTYGKKGGLRLGGIKTAYEIFATEQDIENQLQNLDLNKTDLNGGDRSLVLPSRYDGDIKSPVPVKQRNTEPFERSRKLSCQNSDSQSTLNLSVGESSATKVGYCPSNLSKRPRLNGKDEDELISLARLGGNSEIESFSSFAEKIDMHCEVEKVGEGAFSSVFAVRIRGENSTSSAVQPSIMKVIPLRLGSQLDPEDSTTCKDVISEIQISEALNEVHGFLEFRGAKVVYGEWPHSFLQAFRHFKKHQRKRAENPDPRDTYSCDQYYAVLEMSDAGHEFSTHIRRPSAFQMYDIFWMTTIHLAMAEKQVKFEHRDLHISNICVKSAVQSERLDIRANTVQEMQSDPVLKLGLSTLRVAIIDYTLSRVERKDGDISCSAQDKMDDDVEEPIEEEKHEDMLQRIAYEKQSAYLSCVKKEQMADLNGKSTDIYEEKDKWQVYAPRTNIYWLAYLLQVLFHRTGKQQKTMYLPKSNDVAKGVQDRIRASLKEVDELISHKVTGTLPMSAEGLLEIAVQKGWLSQEEIAEFQQNLE